MKYSFTFSLALFVFSIAGFAQENSFTEGQEHRVRNRSFGGPESIFQTSELLMVDYGASRAFDNHQVALYDKNTLQFIREFNSMDLEMTISGQDEISFHVLGDKLIALYMVGTRRSYTEGGSTFRYYIREITREGQSEAKKVAETTGYREDFNVRFSPENDYLLISWREDDYELVNNMGFIRPLENYVNRFVRVDRDFKSHVYTYRGSEHGNLEIGEVFACPGNKVMLRLYEHKVAPKKVEVAVNINEYSLVKSNYHRGLFFGEYNLNDSSFVVTNVVPILTYHNPEHFFFSDKNTGDFYYLKPYALISKEDLIVAEANVINMNTIAGLELYKVAKEDDDSLRLTLLYDFKVGKDIFLESGSYISTSSPGFNRDNHVTNFYCDNKNVYIQFDDLSVDNHKLILSTHFISFNIATNNVSSCSFKPTTLNKMFSYQDTNGNNKFLFMRNSLVNDEGKRKDFGFAIFYKPYQAIEISISNNEITKKLLWTSKTEKNYLCPKGIIANKNELIVVCKNRKNRKYFLRRLVQ
jgi:hypothetical protein